MSNGIRYALSAVIVVLIAVMVFVLVRYAIPDANRDIFMVILGAITVQFKEVYSFWFGSSDGSKQKSDQLAEAEDDAPLDLTGSEYER